MMERVVLVGLGSIGRRHAVNLHELRPEAEIWALRRPETERPGGESRNACHSVDGTIHSLGDALALEPDAALVTNPASCHVDTALEFARRGVSLFIEKPLSHTMEGVDRLLEVCRDRDLCLQIGYNYRFYEPLRRMREVATEGEIGALWGARARAGSYLPDWRPGRDYRETVSARRELGGGAVLELSHELDYLSWMLGEARAVQARLRTSGKLDLDVEDLAEIIVDFEGGVLASIHLNMIQRPPCRRICLHGTEGTLVCDLLRHRLSVRRPGEEDPEVVFEDEDHDRNEMYREELSQFLDCLDGGSRPVVGGEDGKRTLRLALAAKRSSEEGREVRL